MRLSDEELYEVLNNDVVLPYEQELIDNVRNLTYIALPVSVSLLSLPVRNGNCYSMSILLTKGMNGYKLVHGNVNTWEPGVDCPNHSWVEKDGYVYDTTWGCKFEKDFYYEKYEVEVVQVYDEVSVKDYSLYNEVSQKINKNNVPLEQLSMLLQYLEMLEKENNTINHYMLLDEISKCREVYGATTVYDDKVMQKYKEYMSQYKK